jgi:hypothetical protein
MATLRLAVAAAIALALIACTSEAARELARQEAQDAAQVPAAPAPKAADVESIEAIMSAIYDVISGPAGEPRDWDRMRSLFIPEARLIPVAKDSLGSVAHNVLGVEEFIANAKPYFEQNGFYEREIARVTEEFAHIAHVLSTYASFNNADYPEPIARGINSFQLMLDGERWWIVTIYWENESPEQPIPAKYLRRP